MRFNYDRKYNKKIIYFIKILIFIHIIFEIKYLHKLKTSNKLKLFGDLSSLDKNYFKLKNLRNIIKLGIYTYCLKGGGTERITALFINYLSKINIFNIYLFTQQDREENEFIITNSTKRIVIKDGIIENLVKKLKKKKIEILIYQFPHGNDISLLNNLKNINIIFFENSCFLYWIYYHYFSFKSIYSSYQKSKYVISLIPFESEYLYKKWGINSILMNNFITFEYNSVIPSDLSSYLILMVGRGSDRMKRFELGIKSMNDIIKDIPECEMKIISNLNGIDYLNDLIRYLKLENYVKIIGYKSNPEIYFKNASLHIFPSISESFGLVLSETKIFGIPNILVGLDYVSIVKGGTLIIYDDKSETIAKESIKILKDKKYRKQLGKEARKSMKKFKNELLLNRWVKLLLSIYKNDNNYKKLNKKEKKLNKKKIINILKNQVELLRKRIPGLKNITIDNLKNLTFMENLKINT